MRSLQWHQLFTAFAAVCALAFSASALQPGQADDFEDGTTQDWVVGLLGGPHPSPPENVPDGGPNGDGDNYLLLTSIGGDGPGSRLAVINLEQWAGDYTAAGIESISMDLWNASNADLYIRLLFEDPTVGPPENVATTEAVFLPAGSGWMSVEFAVGPDDLIAILGDIETVLSNTTALRIFHNEEPSFPPPPVTARLGVDNIRALPTPTPVLPASWGSVKHRFR